jgi:hypothetical protein
MVGYGVAPKNEEDYDGDGQDDVQPYLRPDEDEDAPPVLSEPKQENQDRQFAESQDWPIGEARRKIPVLAFGLCPAFRNVGVVDANVGVLDV